MYALKYTDSHHQSLKFIFHYCRHRMRLILPLFLVILKTTNLLNITARFWGNLSVRL